MTKRAWVFRDAVTGDIVDLTPLKRSTPARRHVKRIGKRKARRPNHEAFTALALALTAWIFAVA